MAKPRSRAATREIPAWADALRERRVALGLSQEDVAARAGDIFSQRLVSNFENGVTDLADTSIKRAAALARALNWTLLDLQRATGIDFAVPDAGITLVSDRSEPVYHLRLAAQDTPSTKPLGYELVEGAAPPRLRIFEVDTDEMHAIIRQGERVYVDLEQREPQLGHVYVIQEGDVVHLRAFGKTRFGPAWIAENRNAHPDIPASDVTVIGHVFRVTYDRESPRLTN